jgi:hypothetical protein
MVQPPVAQSLTKGGTGCLARMSDRGTMSADTGGAAEQSIKCSPEWPAQAVVFYSEEEDINASYTDGQQSQDRTK